jgi:HAD superfamily hydrolase (TIGR01509 family)
VLEMVIFDMDGVIVDSEEAYHDVEMKLFGELGLDMSEEERYGYVGTKTVEMWTELKQKYNLAHSVQELVKLETVEFISYLKSKKGLKPIEGVVELIRSLHDKGVVLALASSSRTEEIDVILELFDLKKYFSFIVSGDDVKAGKPAPDIFEFVCRQAGIVPQNCVIIEDSTNGLKAAKAANIKCVGFRNAGSGNQDLSLADMVTQDFRELDYEVLGKLLCHSERSEESHS